ncbi:NAD(P)/FAD-dependent oxidoreductase [Duganella qianjiadongensis]|uniref:FAD-dependent oxidoreductase n=1 Tax=Duganella qianjiadongensis TaxID=2692176 RepID=A0ABW9VMB9_9BURK|nr:FAD/NAD(P)-binding oxidoreductase [Duganella qianjiadongensis]MYM38807.1 FAD-dependent oxidoreductase [Duganella qianjiadongensis]
MKYYDILVVGAGPAGLAAAQAAAASGRKVGIIDDNPQAGGQIWRGGPASQSDARARTLWLALHDAPNVEFLSQTRVLYAPAPQQLQVQTPVSGMTLHYQRLILATGARERLLPFPGWTLPGVTGAGGLQALSKGGYPVAGKRVVVAGTGPLLLAVAATLRARGAEIVAIIEQAPMPALARFGAGLLATPSKAVQALQLARQLRGIPYWTDSYVRAALDDAMKTQELQAVQVQRGSSIVTLECDYLACGYGLLPNVELAQALGAATHSRKGQTAVSIDSWQQTCISDVYCAGEGTGIGGVDLALVEGRIAGLAASGAVAETETLFRQRTRWRKFASRLERGFALRAEVLALAEDSTLVCRCEDVCHGDLKTHSSWRSAKLHTRCGMGPCQGRICGGATELLYGWRPAAVRSPIVPARVASMIASAPEETPDQQAAQ